MVQETSIISYHELDPDTDQIRVMRALRALNVATDREIADYLWFSDPNRVRPRRNELVRLGLVEPKGKRLCKVSGRLSLVWGASW